MSGFIKKIIKNINCPLTKEERELLNKLKKSYLTINAYNFYISKLKNNKEDSYELAHKKIIRNILLSEQAPLMRERKERRCFYMGNLQIIWMEDSNEIVWLDNKKGYYPCYIDQDKKKWLNEELGINTYKMEKVG